MIPVEVQERVLRLTLGLLIFVTLVLAVFALRALYIVLMPLVFALFLTTLLRPVQAAVNDRLSRRFNWLGTLLAVLTFLVILGLALASIWWSITLVSEKGQEYRETFSQHWEQARSWLQRHNIPVPSELAGETALPGPAIEAMTQSVRSSLYLGTLMILIFFLMLLLLIELHEWKRKSLEAFYGARTRKIVETVEAVAVKLRHFFYLRALISLVSAIVEGLWIWALGIDFAFVWALLFFVLNFIPNVGSILAAIPPILLALVQFGPWYGLLTALGLLAIEQFMANFLDPLIQGRVLQISPVVVVVSIIFWSWAWGIAGMFLAVPIMITIMIVCAHVPVLQPVAILLSRPDNEDLVRKR